MNAPGLDDRKRQVRATVRARRQVLSSGWVEQASRRVQERLEASVEWERARWVGLYLAMPWEVRMAGLIAAARRAGKRVAVPAWRPGASGYVFCDYPEGARLVSGPHRVRQPDPAEPVRPGDLDLVVVPGVAFDRRGARVGHGGGHYDRLLAAGFGAGVVFAGVAFDYQLFDEVPAGTVDIRMMCVVTEEEWIRVEDTKEGG